jgi:hypothetical protein
LLFKALAQKGSTSGPTNASQARPVEVRLRDISPYKGASGDALDAWFGQLDLNYDDFVTVQGATETRFVAAAARTLQEAAVVWWQSLPPASRPATWTGMKAALRQQFQPVDSEERARDSLMQLKQSAKQSVVDYAAAFRRLLTRCGSTFNSAPAMQEFLTERFVNGLHSADIRRDLKKAAVKGLTTAVEMATRLDNCDGASSSSSGLAAADTTTAATGSVLEQLSLLAAEVQAMRREREATAGRYDSRRNRGANKNGRGGLANSVPGLSETAARARIANGQCLWCGSKDHVKRDCPDRANDKKPSLN